MQRWALAMRERGFDVSVLSAEPQDIPDVPVSVLPPPGRRTGWFARVPAVRRAVASLAPDIVHAHYVTSYGMLGALCGRTPLVLTAWGSDILVSPRKSAAVRCLTGWTLRRAALVTADSRDVLEAIRAYRPRAGLEEVFWGADTTRFQPRPAEERPPGFHVASLRAWEPNYRIELIVRAFVELLRSGPAKLHLFGGGSGELALRALVQELGIADAVYWHGKVPAHRLAHQLADCSVSVSVPRHDATSVALLESMSCGMPVVVSDVPANRQWVSPEGGVVLDGDTVASLARALCMLRDDPARSARMGAHNRALIEARGASAVQMDRMAGLYRDLAHAAPTA